VPKLRVHNMAMSLDGYAAGLNQSIDNPLGAGGTKLHEWIFATRYGNRMLGLDTGDEGMDDQFLAQGDLGIGATIMGRNMFGPVRGSWTDEQWVGWWGDNPPYHHPVYVLTHHPRSSIVMKGGTIFHFVTDGIEVALDRALEAANGRDVRLGGGPATIQQYLRAGLIDEMHVAIVPVLLGSGERLFDHVDASAAYRCVELVSSPAVTHVRLARREP
jgi:dihydrofolate reductase